MSRIWRSASLCFVVVTATALAAQQTPPAATSPAGSGGLNRAPAASTGPAPRLANGQIDLSGVWQGGGPVGNIADGLAKGETLPIKPEWKKIMEGRKAKDDPEANCLPTGVPRRDPYPWRILQTPTHTFLLFEGNIHSYRQIFMDGRKHPEDLDPTWYGHSVGHWEGDTLVVDTVGFNDRFWFDFQGTPHTEKLHTIERYTRTNIGTLVIETTIDDPGAYTKPFKISFTARLRPGEELMEYICNENNGYVQHITGAAKEF
ncbi:MAG TPA: hypothetical protein VGF24_18325 [Vicinamibacterales bacterium]|jgi:hypothetical protein